MADPFVSVIVPLLDHRGHALNCVRRWCQKQTHVRDQYEVIVVSANSNRRLDREVARLLDRGDTLLGSGSTNLFETYNLAARHARGKLLFLTEGHCWPAATCLENVKIHYDACRPAGGFCRSMGVANSRWARIEQRMFESSLTEQQAADHWRRIIIHGCFLERQLFEEMGGFDAQYGQFSEWLLAAKLHAAGHRLDYVPEAAVYHSYSGSLSFPLRLARDFTNGEMAVRSRYPAEFCDRYFGVAEPGARRGDYDGSIARGMCRALFQDAVHLPLGNRSLGRLGSQLRCLARQAGPAAWGIRGRLFGQACALRTACWKMRWWPTNESRQFRLYRSHWDAAIRHCRLRWLAEHSSARDPRGDSRVYNLADCEIGELVGFHRVETWQGQRFRWSEPVCWLPVALRPGAYRVCIRLAPVFPDWWNPKLAVTFGRRYQCGGSIHLDGDRLSFQIDPTMFVGDHRAQGVTMICTPFAHGRRLQRKPRGALDQRELGLPLVSIQFEPLGVASLEEETDADSRTESSLGQHIRHVCRY